MISSSWKFSMTPGPSLARISSRICSTLGASPEPSVRWRGTRKSRIRRPSWYLTVGNARFRPNIPTVLWSALVAMRLTAGLRLDNIVWKRLSKRLSCWIWKISYSKRKTLYFINLILKSFQRNPYLDSFSSEMFHRGQINNEKSLIQIMARCLI